jgi:hypothetical protein
MIMLILIEKKIIFKNYICIQMILPKVLRHAIHSQMNY